MRTEVVRRLALALALAIASAAAPAGEPARYTAPARGAGPSAPGSTGLPDGGAVPTSAVATGTAPEMIVEAPPELAPLARRVAAVDRRRLAAAVRLTGLRRPGPPVRVVLAPEGSPAAAAVPPWVSGYAYGALGRVVLLPERTPSYPNGSLEELLVHELTHVYVARAAGGKPVPRWFNEGLAMLAGGPWGLDDRSRLTFALVRRTEVPLPELEQMFSGDGGEVRRAYAVAGALVRDLVLRQGHKAPRRVLAGLARGLPFPEAFLDGADTSLEAATRSFWSRHSFWYRWVPLLGSSFVLWLMIIALAAVAYWRKRRRVAALERAWEEEMTPGPEL